MSAYQFSIWNQCGPYCSLFSLLLNNLLNIFQVGVKRGQLNNLFLTNLKDTQPVGSDCSEAPQDSNPRRDWNSSSSFSKTHPPFALAKGNFNVALLDLFFQKGIERSSLHISKCSFQLSTFWNFSISLMQIDPWPDGNDIIA